MRKQDKNLDKKEIINKLYQTGKNKNKDIYSAIAKELNRAARTNINVNISKLEKLPIINDGDIVVIPGKLLGAGLLNKKITIYAYSFSQTAKDKLGNSIKNIFDFCNDKIDYKVVKIIK